VCSCNPAQPFDRATCVRATRPSRVEIGCHVAAYPGAYTLEGRWRPPLVRAGDEQGTVAARVELERGLVKTGIPRGVAELRTSTINARVRSERCRFLACTPLKSRRAADTMTMGATAVVRMSTL